MTKLAKQRKACHKRRTGTKTSLKTINQNESQRYHQSNWGCHGNTVAIDSRGILLGVAKAALTTVYTTIDNVASLVHCCTHVVTKHWTRAVAHLGVMNLAVRRFDFNLGGEAHVLRRAWRRAITATGGFGHGVAFWCMLVLWITTHVARQVLSWKEVST